MNIYLYTLGGGCIIKEIAMLNVGVWAFTRGIHK